MARSLQVTFNYHVKFSAASKATIIRKARHQAPGWASRAMVIDDWHKSATECHAHLTVEYRDENSERRERVHVFS
ncbi:hypothetical protein E4T42_04239 [Aureobasidium subglaciale]|nr:hypothetical protein E4T42_04239 [Aureobasidium subglaciale]